MTPACTPTVSPQATSNRYLDAAALPEAPIIVEARGPAGALHLELSPAAAEALGLALIRHAARVES